MIDNILSGYVFLYKLLIFKLARKLKIPNSYYIYLNVKDALDFMGEKKSFQKNYELY